MIDVLRKEFNGKHIFTNPVEGVHSHFPLLLTTHRTEKGTTRLINVVLHICFSLHTFEQILPFEEFTNIKVKREKEIRLEIGKEYLIRYVNASNILTEFHLKRKGMKCLYICTYMYITVKEMVGGEIWGKRKEKESLLSN